MLTITRVSTGQVLTFDVEDGVNVEADICEAIADELGYDSDDFHIRTDRGHIEVLDYTGKVRFRDGWID